MAEIIDKCTLCGKALKHNPEEACEGDECEGTYEFRNDSDSVFNFCNECRMTLEQKDKEYNAWRKKWKYYSGTYKSGEL